MPARIVWRPAERWVEVFCAVGPRSKLQFVPVIVASALERAGIMGLVEGQRVAIDAAQGQKGPEAVGLRLI